MFKRSSRYLEVELEASITSSGVIMTKKSGLFHGVGDHKSTTFNYIYQNVRHTMKFMKWAG